MFEETFQTNVTPPVGRHWNKLEFYLVKNETSSEVMKYEMNLSTLSNQISCFTCSKKKSENVKYEMWKQREAFQALVLLIKVLLIKKLAVYLVMSNKFTIKNNVETKQPWLQSRLKNSRPAIKKISTCHHESLDLSSWKFHRSQ